MTHTELSWNQENKKIYAQSRTIPNSKAILCIVHGLCEHSGRYARPAKLFNKNGISVFAVDQFGHGKTEGMRGYSPSYEATLDLVNNLMKESTKKEDNIPVFFRGHSMGGNVVLNYLLRRKPDLQIKGAIVSAPWLRLAFEPSKFKIMIAKLMKNVYPKFVEKVKMDIKYLSRDKEEIEKYKNDPLVHNQITVGTFLEIFDAGYGAINHAESLTTPIFLIHGSSDKLISLDGSQCFNKNAPNELISYKEYNGFYHELHNEPKVDRTKVLTDMINWINSRLT